MRSPFGRFEVWWIAGFLGLGLLGCGDKAPEAADELTPAMREVRTFALAEFERARSVLDPSDTTEPRVRFTLRAVEVLSDRWRLVFEAGGRRSIQPASVYAHMAAAFQQEIPPADVEYRAGLPVPAGQVQQARDLLLDGFEVTTSTDPDHRPIAHREVLRTREQDASEPDRHHLGRTRVLFSLPGTGDRKFTHAVTFGPEGEPHGFETYDGSDAVRKVADNFTSACASGEVFPTHLYDRNLRVGTFFDDYAFLFEVFAYSYEGEPFLESGGFYPRDWPFGPPADWPSCWEYPLDVDALRATDLYKARVWDASLTASNHHGGLRGLWDEGQGEWENDTVRIQHHESLGEYARTGGTDLVQMGRMFCGSEWREFQTVEGSTLEDRFYDDLEACHIAILLTYGGLKARPNHIQQAYQLRCDLDRWCPLHVEGQPALGLGNLRVLLLRTGSSMNWLREPPAKGGGLEDDWMNFHVADGLRLVCGHDGRHEAAIHLREREGWYFCRRYGGQALSVTDAWIRTALDVDYSGSPVVVAYGATLAEAAGTLYDGRFDKTPGGKGWIVAVASFRVGAPD